MIDKLIINDMRFCKKCNKRRLNKDFRTKNTCIECHRKYNREYQRRIAREKK